MTGSGSAPTGRRSSPRNLVVCLDGTNKRARNGVHQCGSDVRRRRKDPWLNWSTTTPVSAPWEPRPRSRPGPRRSPGRRDGRRVRNSRQHRTGLHLASASLPFGRPDLRVRLLPRGLHRSCSLTGMLRTVGLLQPSRQPGSLRDETVCEKRARCRIPGATGCRR